MSAETILDRAFAPLQQAVEAGRIPGGVLGVVERGGDRATRAIGSAQLVPDARPMTEATWFDLASLTKVLFTTPAILALVAEGRIGLDDPLPVAIPDLRQYDKAGAAERRTAACMRFKDTVMAAPAGRRIAWPASRRRWTPRSRRPTARST